MKTIMKTILIFLLLQNIANAGAYLDTYTVEIQREIQQINIKIQNNTASNREKKHKEYLEKRLNALQKQQPRK